MQRLHTVYPPICNLSTILIKFVLYFAKNGRSHNKTRLLCGNGCLQTAVMGVPNKYGEDTFFLIQPDVTFLTAFSGDVAVRLI